MKFIFWTSFTLVAYAYVGYAFLLLVWVRLRRHPLLQKSITPTVSIIMAAHNEELRLPTKLANVAALHYPKEQLQIIVASDGSTDQTVEILRANREVVPVILPQARGKACALNQAVAFATGEILVFLDVRQTVEPNAVSELVSCFTDPGVGAVSGELLLEAAADGPSPEALGIYWKIEKMVRRLESETGSVVGVTGAIYALRRELYVEIPAGTILDDVFVPMNVARRGKRVVFQSSAIARDRIFSEPGKEFSRKARTLTGNYQLLRIAPWLLSPQNPLLFRFISHKLMRLVVPLLLVMMLLTSATTPAPLYRSIFAVQLVFYGLAAIGMLFPRSKRAKPIAIASTFVMLNAAAAVAFSNFIMGREKVWV
ncbi:MAG: glycosyltransferase family 2 protein [Acidobacteriota bacterium]|nr:glycosyltransferase family 2 protein [Acidobacteriota bacterium]